MQELLEILGHVYKVCGELYSVKTLENFKRKALNINGYLTFTADINYARLIGSDDINASNFAI